MIINIMTVVDRLVAEVVGARRSERQFARWGCS